MLPEHEGVSRVRRRRKGDPPARNGDRPPIRELLLPTLSHGPHEDSLASVLPISDLGESVKKPRKHSPPRYKLDHNSKGRYSSLLNQSAQRFLEHRRMHSKNLFRRRTSGSSSISTNTNFNKRNKMVIEPALRNMPGGRERSLDLFLTLQGRVEYDDDGDGKPMASVFSRNLRNYGEEKHSSSESSSQPEVSSTSNASSSVGDDESILLSVSPWSIYEAKVTRVPGDIPNAPSPYVVQATDVVETEEPPSASRKSARETGRLDARYRSKTSIDYSNKPAENENDESQSLEEIEIIFVGEATGVSESFNFGDNHGVVFAADASCCQREVAHQHDFRVDERIDNFRDCQKSCSLDNNFHLNEDRGSWGQELDSLALLSRQLSVINKLPPDPEASHPLYPTNNQSQNVPVHPSSIVDNINNQSQKAPVHPSSIVNNIHSETEKDLSWKSEPASLSLLSRQLSAVNKPSLEPTTEMNSMPRVVSPPRKRIDKCSEKEENKRNDFYGDLFLNAEPDLFSPRTQQLYNVDEAMRESAVIPSLPNALHSPRHFNDNRFIGKSRVEFESLRTSSKQNHGNRQFILSQPQPGMAKSRVHSHNWMPIKGIAPMEEQRPCSDRSTMKPYRKSAINPHAPDMLSRKTGFSSLSSLSGDVRMSKNISNHAIDIAPTLSVPVNPIEPDSRNSVPTSNTSDTGSQALNDLSSNHEPYSIGFLSRQLSSLYKSPEKSPTGAALGENQKHFEQVVIDTLSSSVVDECVSEWNRALRAIQELIPASKESVESALGENGGQEPSQKILQHDKCLTRAPRASQSNNRLQRLQSDFNRMMSASLAHTQPGTSDQRGSNKELLQQKSDLPAWLKQHQSDCSSSSGRLVGSYQQTSTAGSGMPEILSLSEDPNEFLSVERGEQHQNEVTVTSDAPTGTSVDTYTRYWFELYWYQHECDLAKKMRPSSPRNHAETSRRNSNSTEAKNAKPRGHEVQIIQEEMNSENTVIAQIQPKSVQMEDSQQRTIVYPSKGENPQFQPSSTQANGLPSATEIHLDIEAKHSDSQDVHESNLKLVVNDNQSLVPRRMVPAIASETNKPARSIEGKSKYQSSPVYRSVDSSHKEIVEAPALDLTRPAGDERPLGLRPIQHNSCKIETNVVNCAPMPVVENRFAGSRYDANCRLNQECITSQGPMRDDLGESTNVKGSEIMLPRDLHRFSTHTGEKRVHTRMEGVCGSKEAFPRERGGFSPNSDEKDVQGGSEEWLIQERSESIFQESVINEVPSREIHHIVQHESGQFISPATQTRIQDEGPRGLQCPDLKIVDLTGMHTPTSSIYGRSTTFVESPKSDGEVQNAKVEATSLVPQRRDAALISCRDDSCWSSESSRDYFQADITESSGALTVARWEGDKKEHWQLRASSMPSEIEQYRDDFSSIRTESSVRLEYSETTFNMKQCSQSVDCGQVGVKEFSRDTRVNMLRHSLHLAGERLRAKVSKLPAVMRLDREAIEQNLMASKDGASENGIIFFKPNIKIYHNSKADQDSSSVPQRHEVINLLNFENLSNESLFHDQGQDSTGRCKRTLDSCMEPKGGNRSLHGDLPIVEECETIDSDIHQLFTETEKLLDDAIRTPISSHSVIELLSDSVSKHEAGSAGSAGSVTENNLNVHQETCPLPIDELDADSKEVSNCFSEAGSSDSSCIPYSSFTRKDLSFLEHLHKVRSSLSILSESDSESVAIRFWSDDDGLQREESDLKFSESKLRKKMDEVDFSFRRALDADIFRSAAFANDPAKQQFHEIQQADTCVVNNLSGTCPSDSSDFLEQKTSSVQLLYHGSEDPVEVVHLTGGESDLSSGEEIEIIFVEESFLASDGFSFGDPQGVVFDWMGKKGSVAIAPFEIPRKHPHSIGQESADGLVDRKIEIISVLDTTESGAAAREEINRRHELHWPNRSVQSWFYKPRQDAKISTEPQICKMNDNWFQEARSGMFDPPGAPPSTSRLRREPSVGSAQSHTHAETALVMRPDPIAGKDVRPDPDAQLSSTEAAVQRCPTRQNQEESINERAAVSGENMFYDPISASRLPGELLGDKELSWNRVESLFQRPEKQISDFPKNNVSVRSREKTVGDGDESQRLTALKAKLRARLHMHRACSAMSIDSKNSSGVEIDISFPDHLSFRLELESDNGGQEASTEAKERQLPPAFHFNTDQVLSRRMAVDSKESRADSSQRPFTFQIPTENYQRTSIAHVESRQPVKKTSYSSVRERLRVALEEAKKSNQTGTNTKSDSSARSYDSMQFGNFKFRDYTSNSTALFGGYHDQNEEVWKAPVHSPSPEDKSRSIFFDFKPSNYAPSSISSNSVLESINSDEVETRLAMLRANRRENGDETTSNNSLVLAGSDFDGIESVDLRSMSNSTRDSKQSFPESHCEQNVSRSAHPYPRLLVSDDYDIKHEEPTLQATSAVSQRRNRCRLDRLRKLRRGVGSQTSPTIPQPKNISMMGRFMGRGKETSKLRRKLI